jgi:predicted nucleic acid-binding protein
MGTIKAADQIIERMLGKRVYFDSAPIIYALENNPRYAAIALKFTDAAEKRQFFGFTGTMVLVEMLVKPLREQNTALVAHIKQLFAIGDVFTCLDHPNETLMLSAELRAKNGLKMADAIHMATAIHNRCAFFLTNDSKLKSISTLEVILLEDFVEHRI